MFGICAETVYMLCCFTVCVGVLATVDSKWCTVLVSQFVLVC